MLAVQPKRFFLTIEGIEGVGKSTILQHISEQLSQMKTDFILTREPGGTPIAEELRKILLTPNTEEVITSDTELLLMFAGRAQHIANVIQPALKADKWVVSDRFVDASFAYQGGGRKMDMSRIELLNQWIVNQLQPNATILLDAPPEIGLARAKLRGAHDRIEQEKIDFFQRVRAVYLERAKQNPTRFHIVDATQPLDVVKKQITHLVSTWLAKEHEDHQA
jgi:dTMP kinase